MRLLFGCLVAGFMLMLSLDVQSQNKFSVVQGRILLQKNLLVDAAAIALVRLRDSAVINTITAGTDGLFKFRNVSPGNYLVRISEQGYQLYYSAPVHISTAGLINLPDVTLKPSITNLKEITINNKKTYIETRPDKTILNVEKAGLATGVSVLDVLAAAPGIKVNSGGDILFKGGQKALIAINGRTVSLSGADLNAQLQNLQSSDIGEIELVANPSAKYDAAGAGGLINIILKKGKNEGFNGSITQGAGYGNFYKLNSGVNMNYRNKKFNFFGSYSFGENNTDHTIITNRYVGTLTNFNVDYYSKQKTYASNYTLGTDFTIDPAHTLGVLIVGSFNNNFINKHTESAIANRGINDSTLTTNAVMNRHVNTVNYNVNYNGQLGHTSQTIAADADYSVYNRNMAEDMNSILYNVQTGTNGKIQHYNNLAPTGVINYSGRIDYVNPIDKSRRLEAGLKSSYAKSDNSQQFDNVTGAVAVINPYLSSRFNYTENITGAYANYIVMPSTKFDYQLDLRVEHTESDADSFIESHRVKRSYTDFFPVATFNYNPSASHHFSLTYNRRIDRPTYQELNPIIAFQDKYNLTAGNAYLRPSYQDRIELKHIYKNKIATSLYAAFVRDAFNFTYFAQNDATAIYVTGKANLKRADTYGLNLNIPAELTTWWNLNADIDASYQRYVDYAGLLNKGTGDAIFKLHQQFLLPAGISLTADGQYEVPTFYNLYHYRASYYVQSSVVKSLFNKRANLSFTMQDIFNTNRDRYSSNYANLNFVGYDKKETQKILLSFTYRFGKTTVKASRKHATGNSDDLKRIIGSGN
jgi:iron complex outermembrane receptor protein